MFTTEELENKVIEIATQRPAVRYEGEPGAGCFYERGVCTDGTKGCLIGQALKELGYKPDPESKLPVELVLARLGLGDSYFLSCVQAYQDLGVPWGQAVLEAYETLSREPV